MNKSNAKRTGFYVSFDWQKQISRLSDDQAGVLFKAMFEYAVNKTGPAFSDNLLEFMWISVQQKLDHDEQKYNDTVIQNRRNAFAGGWETYARKNGIDPEDEIAKEAWIDSKMSEADASDRLPSPATACDGSQQNKNINLNEAKNKAPSKAGNGKGAVGGLGGEGGKPYLSSASDGMAMPEVYKPMSESAFEESRERNIAMLDGYLKTKP